MDQNQILVKDYMVEFLRKFSFIITVECRWILFYECVEDHLGTKSFSKEGQKSVKCDTSRVMFELGSIEEFGIKKKHKNENKTKHRYADSHIGLTD